MNTLQKQFEVQLIKSENIITSCSQEKDIPLCIFKKDLRTPFFMMEALCRIYTHMNFEKPFVKWEKRTKIMEDKLGMVDYALWVMDECMKRKILSPEIKGYFSNILNNCLKDVWFVLEDANWCDGQRISKMRRKLGEVKGSSKVDLGMNNFYLHQIDELYRFHKTCSYQDIENDFHELRRKLRWLSIYAHALQGVVTLKESSATSASQIEYLSKKVRSSPFNQLPTNSDNPSMVFLDQNSFMVINAVITELGAWKDEGLLIVALQHFFQEKKKLSSATALNKSYKLLGYTNHRLQEIVKIGKTYVNRFFEENHLHQLIIQ